MGMRDPIKRTIRSRADKAIRSGNIKRPDNCEHCGAKALLDAHHEDYNRPFYLIFLCRSCHTKHHLYGLDIIEPTDYSDNVAKRNLGQKPDKNTLAALMERMSYDNIGLELGVSRNTVIYWAKSYELWEHRGPGRYRTKRDKSSMDHEIRTNEMDV